MSDGALLLGVLGAAALLALAHRQGLRLNVGLARRTARELEQAFGPADATYTWIGGAIGFHASYELRGGATARATVTLLPRQSPLYLPVARVVSGGDRLQITLPLATSPGTEAHLVEPGFLHWRLAGGRSLPEAEADEVVEGGRRLVVRAADEGGRRWAAGLARRLARDRALLASVRHLALEGGAEPCLYASAALVPGAAAGLARLLLDSAERLLTERPGA